MTPAITSLYASLLALLFVVLSVRVIRYRRGNRISLGDAGDAELLQRMRAHANCGEYAPVALILLLMAELNGAPAVALHVLGLMLLGGRVVHAIGFAQVPVNMNMRVGGMALTFLMIVITSVGLLAHVLF